MSTPTIITHPQSLTANDGTSPVFSVEASGDNLSYQWQQSTDGTNWYDRTAERNSFCKIPGASFYENGWQFRCVVSNNDGSTTSNAATLTIVDAIPSFTTQPQNQTVNGGESATFSVETQYYYRQWQVSTDNGETWTNIQSALFSSYTIASANVSENGNKYRCKINNTNHTTYSDAALLTVNAIAPTITAQPQNQTIFDGQSATFEVIATGTEPLSYQWKLSYDGTTWADISGATSESYTVASTASSYIDGNQYRCVVSNTAGSVTSNVATLTIRPASSWTSGTDEEVAALLDAAAAGDIDLQQDAGWAVGDKRTIHINRFIGSGNTVHAAEDLNIVITSFSDYNGCGCVVQFDFANCPSRYQQANDAENVDYDDTELYTETLPALANALPIWLKNRLIPFSVLAVRGSDLPYSIISVPNNKLALRSLSEVLGIETVPDAPNEGARLAYYEVEENRIKTYGIGGYTSVWFTRSRDNRLAASGEYYWYCINFSGSPPYVDRRQTSAMGLAPFGCLGGLPTAPVITTQPQNQTVTSGGNVSFTVAATGDNLGYLWYYSADGINWSDISGSTQATYSLTNVQTAAQGYYRCLVYSGNDVAGGVNSNAAYLTVRNAVPTITTQPQNQTVVSGGTATFAVTASGVVQNYFWEVSTDGGTTWNDYTGTGANTASISFTATNQDGNKYRCKVSNDGGTVTSNAATLTIETPSYPPTITTQPQNQTVNSGDSATFSVTASGDDISYQWQTYRNGAWSSIGGATSASYTVAGAESLTGSKYHCIVSNDAGAVISGEATLTVTAAQEVTTPTVTTHPQSVTVQEGSAASFRVAASGGGLSYQWQVNNGGTWYDVTGAVSYAYNFATSISDNGAQYRCVVANAAGSVISNAAILTVTQNPYEPVAPDEDDTTAMQVMIDGVDITGLIAHRGIKWTRSDIDGPNAGRNILGEMIRDRVSTKMRLDITCIPMTDTQLTMLMNLLMPVFVSVYYKDPVYGVVTKIMYSNNHSSEYLMPRREGQYWHNISFPLIEK